MPVAAFLPVVMALALLGLEACASEIAAARPANEPAEAGSSLHAAPGYRILSPAKFGVSHGEAKDLCRLSEILISPNGRFGFLYEQPSTFRRSASSTNAAIVDLDCVRRRGWAGCEIDAVAALAALRPLGWTADSRSLFVIEGYERLSALQVNGQGQPLLAPEETEVSVPRPLGFSVEPGIIPAGSEAPTLAAALTDQWSQAQRSGPAHSIVWSSRPGSDRKLHLIFRDNQTLNLLLPEGDRYTGSQVRTEWVDDPRLVEAADGRPAVVADGFMAMARNGAVSVERLPWQGRAILDAGSGRVVGFHDEGGILEGQSPALVDKRPIAIGATELLLRVQQAPDYQLAVLTDFNNRRRWVLREPGQADVVSTCDLPSIPAADPIDWPEVDIQRGMLQGAGTPAVPYHFYSQRGRSSQKVAVLFRGGPGQQEIYSTADITLRGLVTAGFDVLVPEYAGNTGAGPDYAARLRREGPISALSHDTAALAKSGILERYETVLAMGESFGAVPAILFEKAVPAVDCTVLSVPYLRHRDPATWTQRSDEGGFAPDYQYRFEASFFGDDIDKAPDGFGVQLRSLVQTWRPRGPVQALFGDADVVSRVEDLDARSPLIVTHVVSAGHGFAAATQDGEQIIRQALQSCAPDGATATRAS